MKQKSRGASLIMKGNIKHANFKKYAEEFYALTKGEDAIFVGYTNYATKKKKAVLLSVPEGLDTLRAYLLNTDVEGVRFGIPEGARNVASFEGEMKVLDDDGVRRIVKGDHIYVYEKAGEVFIKVGQSEESKKRAQKSSQKP